MARRTAEAAGAAEALMRPGSGLRDLDALLRLRSRKTLGARSVRGGGGGSGGFWLRTWRLTRPAPSAASGAPAIGDSEARQRAAQRAAGRGCSGSSWEEMGKKWRGGEAAEEGA